MQLQGSSEPLTFLFTDIEGSTRLWESEPITMGLSVARHDQIMTSIVRELGGEVFKTLGDGICAAFRNPVDAVRAAVAMQHWVVVEAWPEQCRIRVRMGVHTGAAERRQGDYFGATLSHVSRLTNLGHGGQILISSETRNLVLRHLDSDLELRDMGFQRLRDLQGAHRVYQLIESDLPSEFPPLRSAASTLNNLPEQVSSFIGRAREKTEVSEMLAQNRLVVLTGPGGCGKTRLALQIAAESISRFRDGVWQVDLAHVSTSTLVPDAVAEALDIPLESRSTEEILIEALREKSLLIVFDNCEHVLQAAAQTAMSLLSQCPQLRLLASSRERFGILGEAAYQVPPLTVPPAGHIEDPDKLLGYESVQLFLARSRAANSDLVLNARNAHAVADLCIRLDGIPLAIELAAARTRTMTAQQIEARLDDRFRLLTGGNRVALPRQQTLRALVDWSYDLLSDPERVLLNRLSVFVGGWRIEEAESVCSDESIKPWMVLDVLSGLYEKSMVVRETRRDGAVRFRLLETVRDYARENLVENEAEPGPLRARHASAYLALAENVAPSLIGKDAREGFNRLAEDHDNIRASLDWFARDVKGAVPGLQLVIALQRFWTTRGTLKEGWKLAARALERREEAPLAIATRALFTCAFCATGMGEVEVARSLFQEALTKARSSGDKIQEGRALSGLAGLAGDYDLDFRASFDLNQAALAIHAEASNVLGQAAALYNLADLTLRHDPRHSGGDAAEALKEAKAFFEDSLRLFGQLDDQKHQGICLNGLGCIARQSKDLEGSRRYFVEALEMFNSVGDAVWCGNLYKTFAELSWESGAQELAPIFAGVGQQFHDGATFVPPVKEQESWSQFLSMMKDRLPAETMQGLYRHGSEMDPADAMALASGKPGRLVL